MVLEGHFGEPPAPFSTMCFREDLDLSLMTVMSPPGHPIPPDLHATLVWHPWHVEGS